MIPTFGFLAPAHPELRLSISARPMLGQFLKTSGIRSRCHDELVTPERYEIVRQLERGELPIPSSRQIEKSIERC